MSMPAITSWVHICRTSFPAITSAELKLKDPSSETSVDCDQQRRVRIRLIWKPTVKDNVLSIDLKNLLAVDLDWILLTQAGDIRGKIRLPE